MGLKNPKNNATIKKIRRRKFEGYRIILIFLKDAGCEESTYPVEADKKKCWHFVKATSDYGFIEGAYDVLESAAYDIRILEIALVSFLVL